jgi:hypothetical protein
MDKTTLSVLAFCLGAGGVARAQEMIDLQTLKVLDEERASNDEYNQVAGHFPGVLRSNITAANYDTINSNLTAGNYDTVNSNITAGNYDTVTSNLTAANYDTVNSNVTSSNYGFVDPDQLSRLEQMPSPQTGD